MLSYPGCHKWPGNGAKNTRRYTFPFTLGYLQKNKLIYFKKIPLIAKDRKMTKKHVKCTQNTEKLVKNKRK